MKVKGICLQDLHFGHKETARMYGELEIVKNYIVDNDLQFIHINGDYFHKKLSLNDQMSVMAIRFFADLVSLAEEKSIAIRVVQGTLSHDLNQMSVFDSYLNNPKLDMKIIRNVTKEYIERYNLNVLYIPEEYVEDNDSLYEEYRNDKYDMIHGHGTWDFVAFKNQIEESNNRTKLTAPIFMYDEWKDAIGDGFVIFGHIHGRNTYKKKIFYSGSFTRWGFGESSDRGFSVYEIDTETKEYVVSYINNDVAPKYNTYNISEMFSEDTAVEDICQQMLWLQESEPNVRFDLSSLGSDKIELIKEVFNKKSTVKLENKDIKIERSHGNEDAIYEKYAYIFKKELPRDETIQKFIKEEYGKDITLESIRSNLIEDEK